MDRPWGGPPPAFAGAPPATPTAAPFDTILDLTRPVGGRTATAPTLPTALPLPLTPPFPPPPPPRVTFAADGDEAGVVAAVVAALPPAGDGSLPPLPSSPPPPSGEDGGGGEYRPALQGRSRRSRRRHRRAGGSAPRGYPVGGGDGVAGLPPAGVASTTRGLPEAAPDAADAVLRAVAAVGRARGHAQRTDDGDGGGGGGGMDLPGMAQDAVDRGRRYGSAAVPFDPARSGAYRRPAAALGAAAEPAAAGSYWSPAARAQITAAALRTAGVAPDRAVATGRLLAATPLHDPPVAAALVRAAVTDRLWRRPLGATPVDGLRAYLGARPAIYFAFASTVGRGFWAASSVAAPLLLAASRSRDRPATVAALRLATAPALVAWAVGVLEGWKRRVARLRFRWGIAEAHASRGDDVRPGLRGRVRPGFYCEGGWVDLRDVVVDAKRTLIAITDPLWRVAAGALTRLENHRTVQGFQDSLVLKRFFFMVVTNFATVFYLAFVRPLLGANVVGGGCERGWVVEAVEGGGGRAVTGSCLTQLQTQLLSTAVTKATLQQLAEVALPWAIGAVRRVLSRRRGEGTESRYVSELQLPAHEAAVSVEDYAEQVIQYAYVALFGLASPAVALIAAVNAMVETRSDAFKLLTLHRRPEVDDSTGGGGGIGAWAGVLQALALVAVPANLAVVLLTNDGLAPLLYRDAYDSPPAPAPGAEGAAAAAAALPRTPALTAVVVAIAAEHLLLCLRLAVGGARASVSERFRRMGLPPMGPGEATAALAASELKTKEAPDDVAPTATKDAMDVSPSADVGGAAPAGISCTTADAPSKADGNAAFAPVPAGNLPESGGGPRGSAARRKRPRPVDATGGANTAPSSPPISSPVAGGGASANAEESTAASRSASQRKDRRRGGYIVRGGYVEYPNGFKMRWAPVLLPPPSPPRRGGRAKRTKPPATTASGDDVDVGDGGGVVAGAAAAISPSPVLASLIDAPTTPDGGLVGGATAGTAVASCDTPPKGTIGRVATGDHPPLPGRDGTAGDDSAGAHPVTYNREHNLSAVFGSSSGGSGGKAAGSPGSASVAAGEGSGRGGVSRDVGGGSGGAGSAGGDGHPMGVTVVGAAGAVGAAGVVGAGAAGAGSASPLVASSRPSVGDEQPVTVAVRPNRGRKDPPNGRRVVGISDGSDGDGLLHSVEALRRLLTLLRKQPPKHKAGVTPQWVATAAAATGFPADVVGAYLAAAATELAALAAPGSGGSPVPPGAARLAAYVAADLFHARLRRAAAAAEVLALPDSAESGEEVRGGGDAIGGDFFDPGADVPRVEVDTVRLHVERQAEVLAAREVASARSAWQQDLSDVRARLISEATEMTALDAERERADGALRSARAAGEREAAACDGVEDELRAARFHELDARRRLDRARLKLAAMRGHVDVATVDALAVGGCSGPVDGSDVHGNVPAAVDADDELAADELLQEPTELSQLRSLAAMLTSEVADWGVHATEEARRCRLLTATLVRLEEEVARSRATQGSAGGFVGPGGGGGAAALVLVPALCRRLDDCPIRGCLRIVPVKTPVALRGTTQWR
ncbi:hypothetical protein I4F81_003719 [Pyropia yezoensis]|uniref:Uncharacterized protein n=1 Tax=Pyropia yezoensis TaxID=2788 RepID=A0ACC3BT39_PYRYE|nr:hypothetical protein I4F81_003719 [Neopyropia yezoensis]